MGGVPSVFNPGRCDTTVSAATDLQVKFVPVEYDHQRLARQMQAEGLPDEFIETIVTGWWSTCLEVLPAKERQRGRY